MRTLFLLLTIWLIGVANTILLSQYSSPRNYYYLMDSNGNKVMADSIKAYDMLSVLHEDSEYLGTKYQAKYGVIDSLGNVVFPFISTKRIPFYQSYIVFPISNDKGKKGFVNTNGEVIIPFGKYLNATYIDANLEVCDVGIPDPNDNSELLWGLINLKTGEELIPTMYDKIGSFNNGYAIIYLNGKRGLISKTGKEILPLIHDKIKRVGQFREHLLIYNVDDKYCLIDNVKNEIVIEADYIKPYVNNHLFIPIRRNGKYAFVNENLEYMTPFIYDEPKTNSKHAAAGKRDGIYYLLNKEGKEVLSNKGAMTLIGDEVFCDQGGYDVYNLAGEKISKDRNSAVRIAVRNKSGKLGFKDENGTLVIPHRYTYYNGFTNDRCIVGLRWYTGKGGVIDIDNNVVLPFKYDGLDFTSDGNLILTQGKKTLFADRDGKPLSEHIYSDFEFVQLTTNYWTLLTAKRYYKVKRAGKWTLVDGYGKELLPLYDDLKVCEHNDSIFCIIKQNDKWGLWDLAANEKLLPHEFDEIFLNNNPVFVESLDSNLIYLKKNDKWSACDFNKKMIADFIFDDKPILSLRNPGLIRGKINGLYGIIDSTGKEIIPFKNNRITPFYDLFIAESEVLY